MFEQVRKLFSNNKGGSIREPVGNKTKDKFLLIFVFGVTVRFLVAPYLSNFHMNIEELDLLFVYGFNPFSILVSSGPSIYLSYLPIYIPHLILNYFGLGRVGGDEFVEQFLVKIPQIIGDVVVFYCLYNIALLVSKDKKKSLAVASAYFLNPFVLLLSTVLNSWYSIMMGVVLLSILYLLRGHVGRSALCLAVAVSFCHLPIFLFPVFLAYLWKIDESFLPRAKRFLAIFSISLIVLYSPYFLTFIQLYSSSPSAFWSHIGSYSAPVNPETAMKRPLAFYQSFYYNFTGILATLDLWSSLRALFGLRSLIVLYLVIIAILLKYCRPSVQLINRFIIVFFSLYMVIIPQYQNIYLMWIFPFVLLESIVFLGLPWYYPHVLWISNMLLYPVLTGAFLGYFDATFPGLLPSVSSWILGRQVVGEGVTAIYLSISAIHGLFLVLTIIFCLTSALEKVNVCIQRVSTNFSLKTFLVNRWQSIFFLAYCVLEISRVWYGFGNLIFSLVFITLFLLMISRQFITNRSKGDKPILFTRLSKATAFLYLTSLSGIFLMLMVLQLDLPIFMLIQIILLAGFWIVNKKFITVLNIQRISFIFTIIYVFYFLTISKNSYLGLIALPFLSSWLYLQISTEVCQKRGEIVNV